MVYRTTEIQQRIEELVTNGLGFKSDIKISTPKELTEGALKTHLFMMNQYSSLPNYSNAS